MAKMKLFLCMVFIIFTAEFIECGKFSFGKWGRSSSSKSRGSKSKSSSQNYYPKAQPSYPTSFSVPAAKYPSSSSGLSGNGHNSYNYPSSLSGLSGSLGSGSKYPSSSSGLSGTGQGSYVYPSSSSGFFGNFGAASKYPSSHSGLSGAGNGGHMYPTSGSGLSGSSGKDSKYPQSPSGLSGTGNGGHMYPISGSGLSGSPGKDSKYPQSPSGLSGTGNGGHMYPTSGSGLSGSPGKDSKYPPSLSGLSGTATGHSISKNNRNKPSLHVPPPTASTSHTPVRPVIIRPNSHNTHHHVSHSPSKIFNYPPTYYYSSPQYVYIKEYRNSGSRYNTILTGLALYNLYRSYNRNYNIHNYHDDYYRRRHYSSENSNKNSKYDAVCALKIKENNDVTMLKIPCEIVSTFTKDNKTTTESIDRHNNTVCVTNTTTVNNTAPNVSSNVTAVNSTSVVTTVTNSTSCTVMNVTDPLGVQGPSINTTKNMECSVEIATKDMRIHKTVDCKKLIEYSKVPEPKKEDPAPKKQNILLPEKSKLQSWVSNPPWWLSIFISA